MARNFTYDVFLSFRGKDTRYNFTGTLNKAFRERGIETFFDDQKLRSGDKLTSLFKEIEESRMFVIVLSENYASSTWCLNELVKILQCAEQSNRRIWPIFYKVDPSDIKHQRNSYGNAMIKHEERFGKDSQEVLNWRSALTKVAGLKGYSFTGNYYEHIFIDEIVKEISTKLLRRGLYVGEQVVGLDARLEEVKSLLDISSRRTVCMLGIHGIGGIGKTTLAKALYNSIVHQFDYASFLLDVRETSKQCKGLVSLQKTLLSDMFGVEDIKLRNVDDGAFQIKNSLCNKRILLVLDDVDHEKQLEKLVGRCNWFGSGSRIILTTRNRHLLNVHQVEKSYEMTGLNPCEALELFCWKAFKSSQPPKEFEDLSNNVVNYANGLPLALTVIGSDLCGNNSKNFVAALNRYKRIPNKEIQNILKISYDGLEKIQKDIFLDIACFFRGHSLEEVKNIMDACYLDPEYDIGVIINKSLITVECGLIQIHDLIQDMGKEIVREAAPKDPGRRSRLWLDEEIIKILEEDSGSSKIEGIMLKRPQGKIQWEGTALQKMKNLRILIVKDVDFSIGPTYLPNSLRILEWNQYPLTALPRNFDVKNLVVLQMPESSLKLEISFKNFKHLTVMNFSRCHSITEVPNMSGSSTLKSLNFSQCKNLVKVHDSVGLLTKLTELNLAFCKSLTSLPSAMQMASLEMLNVDDCTSLEYFPDKLGNMDCLSIICASNTAIKKLPNSIGNLMRLNQLNVSWSANLVSIPESIRKLSNLMKLDIEECKNLQEIRKIPSNLRSINAGNCTSLTSHSCSVLSGQAFIETCDLTIDMLGAQIPSWFDYCCKGRFLSFWTRQKLPNAAFAFIYRCEYAEHEVKLRLFINGTEVQNIHWGYFCGSKPCHMYLKDLNQLWGGNRIKGLETYLVQEWNYIDIEVLEHHDFIVDECGIYVYNQGRRMEDIRFDFPYQPPSADLILSNALKRREAFHRENEPPRKLRRKQKPEDEPPKELPRKQNPGDEPPKKLLRKQKPEDYGGKFQNPGTRKSKIYSIKKDDQVLAQNEPNDIDFPCEGLRKLQLPSKVIFFLWELWNDVLLTSDLLNSRHVQVPQTCSLCGVENETSQHIFMECTFARTLWFGSHLSIRLASLNPWDVVHLIKLWVEMGQFDARIHEQYTYPMALILYTIWYFRNNTIFKGETPSSEVALKVWVRFCQKYIVACPSSECVKSGSWEEEANGDFFMSNGGFDGSEFLHGESSDSSQQMYTCAN